MSGNGAPLLRMEACTCVYGSVRALDEADLEVRAGEVVCVLGVNGAGKSTLLSAVAGAVPAASGRLYLNGEDVTALGPEQMVRRGAVLVPEGRGMFASMSVRDNLLLGAYHRRHDGRAVKQALDETFTLFPPLERHAGRAAGGLSGGEQQMVAIGRALMAGPRLLMLDEPSLGLAPTVVRMLMETVAGLADGNRGVLLVEQLARVALTVSHRGYLLEAGRVALAGTSEELQADGRVQEIYMGMKR